MSHGPIKILNHKSWQQIRGKTLMEMGAGEHRERLNVRSMHMVTCQNIFCLADYSAY